MSDTADPVDVVEWRVDRGVAVIELCNPPINGLSADVRAGVDRALNDSERIARDDGIVLVGRGKGFCAGADLQQMGTAKASEESHSADAGRARRPIDDTDRRYPVMS